MTTTTAPASETQTFTITEEIVVQPVGRIRHDWSINASLKSVILIVSYE